MKVTDCCKALPVSNGDGSTQDYAICPKCGEHCEYVEGDDEVCQCSTVDRFTGWTESSGSYCC